MLTVLSVLFGLDSRRHLKSIYLSDWTTPKIRIDVNRQNLACISLLYEFFQVLEHVLEMDALVPRKGDSEVLFCLVQPEAMKDRSRLINSTKTEVVTPHESKRTS